VPDPIAILREMRRVVKPGGIVAVRDVDYDAFRWWPDDARLDAFAAMYLRTARANGGDPTAGRKLHAWAREAGFEREKVTCSATVWAFRSPAEIEWCACNDEHCSAAADLDTLGGDSSGPIASSTQIWRRRPKSTASRRPTSLSRCRRRFATG
jgi:SAM-dependent methyltransferase